MAPLQITFPKMWGLSTQSLFCDVMIFLKRRQNPGTLEMFLLKRILSVTYEDYMSFMFQICY